VARLVINREIVMICYNTGATMLLVDREFLVTTTSAKIKQLDIPIMVKGIGGKSHSSVDYTVLNFYIKGSTNKTKNAVAHIRWEIHVVDNLGPKLLIGMDIIGPEQIGMDIVNCQLVFY
jgi:hypothetical protein